MKQLTKEKGLADKLRDLEIGQTVDIQASAFRVNYVRTAARRLMGEGKEYKVTEKGIVTGCHVTRLR